MCFPNPGMEWGFHDHWETAMENDIDHSESSLDFLPLKQIVRDEIVINCQNQIEGKMKTEGFHKLPNCMIGEGYWISDVSIHLQKLVPDNSISETRLP